MSLVNRIKSLCANKGLSLDDLSKELGFGAKAIYRWDVNSPSIDKVQKVAEYFDTTIDTLYGKKSTNVNIDLTSLPTETQLEIAKIILQEPSMAEIMKKLNDLPPEKRDIIFNLIKTM